MKTEIKPRQPNPISKDLILEVWYGRELIGVITGTEGPGIRFISKYDVDCGKEDNRVLDVGVKLPVEELV